MAEQFDGRVFVTTNVKAQAVKSLLEYWTMKTDMLKKRQNPMLFANKEVQQKTKDYMVNNTKLSDTTFWSSLSANQMEVAMKCFTMQEVPKPKKEILSKNRFKAVVYVCLSGFATMRNMKNQSNVKYGIGDVFGATELFNKVIVEGEEMVDNHPDDGGLPEHLIDFEEGTFMRMELGDLYNTVLKPDEKTLALEEAAKEKEIAARISGIAWEDMSEDDKFYVRVYKRTKELVNKRFFSFLDSYRMIPKNAAMPSFKYYNEGSQGREMYLDDRDPTWVFIIIEGSVRVELQSTKSSSVEHTLTCVRKMDSTPMHIKTRSMPLMLLSSGSVMCIQHECFTLADPKETIDPDSYEALVSPNSKPATPSSQGGKGVLSSKFRSKFPPSKPYSTTGTSTPSRVRRGSEGTIATTNTFNTMGSSIDSRVHRKTDHFIPSSSPPDITDAKYHIKLVFETPTTFLAVPYNNFERILDDGKLILPKIAKEIKWYLNSPNDLVKDRINRLLPWIQGNIDFSKKEVPPKVVHPLGFLANEPGPKLDDRSLPLGSFAPSHHSGPDTGGSFVFSPPTPVLTAPIPSAFDDRSTGGFSLSSSQTNKAATKQAPPKSQQDNTMSAMLAQLRSENTSLRRPKNSMFLTQDGVIDSTSLMNEEEDNDSDSDSDVSLGDFKMPSSSAPMKKSRSPRSGFTDNFRDEILQPPQATVSPVIRPLADDPSTSRDMSKGMNVMEVVQTSFLTSSTSEGRDEVDLQSLEHVSV